MYRTLFCFWKALVRTVDHDGVEHAGYLSFLILLSIFPFVVFFLALSSFLGDSTLGSNFVNLLIEVIPNDASASIRERIFELVKEPPYNLMTVAIVGTIWTSSSFVEGLRTILNRVYQISSPPPYLFRRLLSVIQFLILNGILYIAMLVLVFVPILINEIPELKELIDNYSPSWNILRYILLVMSLFFVVSMCYYTLPNAKVRFKEVIPGSILTVVLWLVSGYLLSSFIVSYHQLNLLYGSLGSIIITLLFFYIFSMLFIYGAEFNYVFYETRKVKK